MLKSFFKEKFLLSFAGVCGVPGLCGVLGVVGVLRGDELRLLADLESASIAWRTIQIGYRKINHNVKIYKYIGWQL